MWSTREFAPALCLGALVVGLLSDISWPVAMVVAAVYVLMLSAYWWLDRRHFGVGSWLSTASHRGDRRRSGRCR